MSGAAVGVDGSDDRSRPSTRSSLSTTSPMPSCQHLSTLLPTGLSTSVAPLLTELLALPTSEAERQVPILSVKKSNNQRIRPRIQNAN